MAIPILSPLGRPLFVGTPAASLDCCCTSCATLSASVEFPSSGWYDDATCPYNGIAQTFTFTGSGLCCSSIVHNPTVPAIYATLELCSNSGEGWYVRLTLHFISGTIYNEWRVSGTGAFPFDTPIIVPHYAYACGAGCYACTMPPTKSGGASNTPQPVTVTVTQ